MADSTISPKIQKQLEAIIKNEVSSRFTDAGRASGASVQTIESELGKLARKLQGAADYDQQVLSGAVLELKEIVKRMTDRIDPDGQAARQAARTGWANFKTVQRAATAAGSKQGVVTPATLRGAMKAKDPSLDKGAVARGDALMQDLIDAGEAVLPSTVPDSGTPLRMAAGGAALGGAAYVDPMMLTGLLAGMTPYTGPGSQISAALLARRPEMAGLLGDVTRQVGLPLAPGFGQAGYQLAE